MWGTGAVERRPVCGGGGRIPSGWCPLLYMPPGTQRHFIWPSQQYKDCPDLEPLGNPLNSAHIALTVIAEQRKKGRVDHPKRKPSTQLLYSRPADIGAMSQYLEAEDKAKPTGMSEFYENAPHAGPSGSEEAAHDSLHQEVLMAGERQEKVIDSPNRSLALTPREKFRTDNRDFFFLAFSSSHSSCCS
jgi:hypothetical protein